MRSRFSRKGPSKSALFVTSTMLGFILSCLRMLSFRDMTRRRLFKNTRFQPSLKVTT